MAVQGTKGKHGIRRLGPDDLDAMRRLNAMFADAFGSPDDYRPQPSDDWLRRALTPDSTIVLVAESGEVVVGGLIAYRLDKLEQARSEVYIYDLAVSEAHRRQGIATELIDAAGRIARAAGAWMMFVQADHVDDAAVALYTRLGTREDVLHFDIPPASD